MGSKRIATAKRIAEERGWGSFIYLTQKGDEHVYVKFGDKWKNVGRKPSGTKKREAS